MTTCEESPCATIRVTAHDRVNREQLATCAAMLRNLAEWFGDSKAVSAYLNDLPSLETYLAQRGSGIVGFAAVKRNGPRVAEIHVMGVARDERRRGVGRALMNRMVEDLARSGINSLIVQTLSPSDPYPAYAETRAFYEAMGFAPLREFQKTDWTDPTLVMVRNL
ncbi:MAG: GNAT family N-acetyltransferase [Gammaproteobacteria bacterium]|nr:GNAT family N-acetyltransferase [Chloroflexota bacterium]MYF28245.1 GNAT family N-acetyltransferase [Gammaproteobacteria bacterium]MYK62455.1 GNAT family N-acetyltransferase [Chloroflexota bacterium]